MSARTLFVAVITCCSLVQSASAQGLLERLERTLRQQAAPERLPEPQPATPPAASPQATGYPSLGVTVDSVTAEIARQQNLAVSRGAMITAIVQGSPADRAGLPLGGVIVAFDGERIDNSKDLVAAVRFARTDRPNELTYYDGARLFRKRVQLLPGTAATRVDPRQPPAAIAPGAASTPTNRRPSSLLEQQLGDQGRRPVLGRVGRLIDDLVAPAGAEAPVAPPAASAAPTDGHEVAELREQVALLQQQLAALQAKMAELEKRLEAKEPAEADDSPF